VGRTARSEDPSAELTKVIRAVVRRSVANSDLRDDLVQEALLRVLRYRDGLDGATLSAYAAVVARNTVRAHHRAERLAQAKHDRAAAAATLPAPPADELSSRIAPDELEAMRVALAELSDADRELLGAVELAEQPHRAAARHHQVSGGTLRVRLHRARARARTRYVIALHGVELPTRHCLGVLDALSMGDRARQRALHADEHLQGCTACASLAEPLLSRRRPLLVSVPFLAWWRWLRRRPAQTGAGTVAAAGILTVLAVAAWPTDNHVRPAVVAAPTTTAATRTASPLRTPTVSLLPVPPDLVAHTGEAVTAASVPVVSVVGDEAFWVGTGPDAQLLVIAEGGESPLTITAGTLVSFTGSLTANSVDVAVDAGIDSSEGGEGGDLLRRQGVHIAVGARAITVTG
jgi:RNA polymerase sigma-70 factor (ECF subfamily)